MRLIFISSLFCFALAAQNGDCVFEEINKCYNDTKEILLVNPSDGGTK